MKLYSYKMLTSKVFKSINEKLLKNLNIEGEIQISTMSNLKYSILTKDKLVIHKEIYYSSLLNFPNSIFNKKWLNYRIKVVSIMEPKFIFEPIVNDYKTIIPSTETLDGILQLMGATILSDRIIIDFPSDRKLIKFKDLDKEKCIKLRTSKLQFSYDYCDYSKIYESDNKYYIVLDDILPTSLTKKLFFWEEFNINNILYIQLLFDKETFNKDEVINMNNFYNTIVFSKNKINIQNKEIKWNNFK